MLSIHHQRLHRNIVQCLKNYMSLMRTYRKQESCSRQSNTNLYACFNERNNKHSVTLLQGLTVIPESGTIQSFKSNNILHLHSFPFYILKKHYTTKSTRSESIQNTLNLKDLEDAQTYRTIYRNPYITSMRLFSRLKLFQTGATVIMIPIVGYCYFINLISIGGLFTTVGVASFAGIMLYVMSYFFTHCIGLIAINATKDTIRVAHLTFWGKRNNIYVPMTDIMPLADASENENEVYVKLHRYSEPRGTYYLFLRHGLVIDPLAMSEVLGSYSLHTSKFSDGVEQNKVKDKQL